MSVARATLVILALSLVTFADAFGGARLIVGAASSLTESITEISELFAADHPGLKVFPSFAGSGVLRVQIERGAPIDVIVSASPSQVQPLIEQGRIKPTAVSVIAGNELVLVSTRGATFRSLDEFRARPGLLLATGDPVRVPAGEYAHRLLSARAWDPALEGRLVPAENVRQVLKYVETGVVSAGLVYRTDAISSDALVTVESFGEGEVGEIRIVAAPLARSESSELATEFVRFLQGELAAEVWTRRGFQPLPGTPEAEAVEERP